jgi:hypothetical protein
MNIRHLLFLVGMVAVSPLLAQTAAPLPGKLAGKYDWHSRDNRRIVAIAVELSEITTDGENVKGVVSAYRSPVGNCVSENTAFKGTYKDGALSIKSGPLKSQFADGRACGGIAIEVKLDGGRASGTLTVGSEVSPIDLEAK